MHASDLLIPVASVLVALITLSGVIFVAVHRKDPTTPELWTENGNLRDRLDKMDETITKQDAKIEKITKDSRLYRASAEKQVTILGSAFDILFRMLGTAQLTPEDKEMVEQARALRTGSGSISLPGVDSSSKEEA